MTPNLRRRHRQIWRTLALILPAAYAAALISLRPPVVPAVFTPVPVDELTAGGYRHETPDMHFSLDAARLSDSRRLGIEVLSPLTSPAAVVALRLQTGDRLLLGQLGPKGSYSFSLDSLRIPAGSVDLMIIDPLKGRILNTLKMP